MAKPKKVVRTKRRDRKNIESGVAHIRSTFNNTIVTITDPHGNAIYGQAPAAKDLKVPVSPLHSQRKWQLNQQLKQLWSTA